MTSENIMTVKQLLIRVQYKDDTIKRLTKIEQGDWIDLRAATDISMNAFEFTYIDLGVAIQLPKGYEAIIAPRSSTFKNFGIIQANSIGVIDNSFCGPNDWWKFPAIALRNTIIRKNDRICQFRIIANQPDVDMHETSLERNVDRGGWGSTGKN